MSTAAVRGEVAGLRAYIGYSRIGGEPEGAVIIFAHNTKEARRVGLRSVLHDITDGDFLDVAIRWLREPTAMRHADPEKLARGEPHVNDSPVGCIDCEYWHAEAYDENGRCEGCADVHLEQQQEKP